LALDAIGQKQLYYAASGEGLIFGSNADLIIQHPGIEAKVSAQVIYDYIYFHHCPSPASIYTQVQKLEGGELLCFDQAKLSIHRYWMPEFQEHLTDSVDESGKQLQSRLIQVVQRYALSADNTGAFLSGGLDSSSVSGALSQVFPGQAKTFTIGFPVEGYDETEYARTASSHFNTLQHEYNLAPEDAIEMIPKIAAYYDEPFGNSSALPAYFCAKMAKENGVKRLLAGDGGDELFAGNERYQRQLLFEYFGVVPGPLQGGLQSGLGLLPEAILKIGLIHKVMRYIEQARTPLPDRLQDYNFLNRHPAADIFQSEFLACVDTTVPLGMLRESYHGPKDCTSLNRMLYMDWKTTLHDNDLVKVNKMCEFAGVEVVYPLLDEEIVDFSCAIPSKIKLKGSKLRWFYKHAMVDFLPEKIINKPKHGFGLPFGMWLKEHKQLREMAYTSLEALKSRNVFKREFLDHAVDMHQSIHASYYGELIWILMMLEMWLSQRNLDV